jgi:hypothetical protein
VKSNFLKDDFDGLSFMKEGLSSGGKFIKPALEGYGGKFITPPQTG